MIISTPTQPVTPEVASFVYEVFQYHLSVARAEASSERSLPSTVMGTLTAVELGCVGDGCNGTKPVTRVPQDPELRKLVHKDPLGHQRYQALRDRDRLTAEAIVFDSKGVALADVTFDKRVLSCTLYQRIGFAIAEQIDKPRYQRWLGKIATKDSAPALQDAERLGSECLQSAAKAWFAVG